MGERQSEKGLLQPNQLYKALPGRHIDFVILFTKWTSFWRARRGDPMEPPKFLSSMDDPGAYCFAEGGPAEAFVPDRRMKLPANVTPEIAGQVLEQVGQVLRGMGLELKLAGHAPTRLAGAAELGIFLSANPEQVMASGWQVLGTGQPGPGQPAAVVAVRR